MQKTSIVILSYREKDAVLQEICSGIEEEGVLYSCAQTELKEVAYELAKKAAKQSALGVGIGICESDFYLVFNTQLGITDLKFYNDSPRLIGQNGARYIKGKPFIIEGM